MSVLHLLQHTNLNLCLLHSITQHLGDISTPLRPAPCGVARQQAPPRPAGVGVPHVPQRLVPRCPGVRLIQTPGGGPRAEDAHQGAIFPRRQQRGHHVPPGATTQPPHQPRHHCASHQATKPHQLRRPTLQPPPPTSEPPDFQRR